MKEALHTMSSKEIDRLAVIQKTKGKQLTRKEAARLLGLSSRQVTRLAQAFNKHGPLGLQSKRRGKKSNRGFSDEVKKRILDLVAEYYRDFGPTLASEKLLEYQEIEISKESLRQWMIMAGLWKGKRRKAVVLHQQRTRRPCFGELVQIDGSHHDWFEGRAPRCCLLVFVDDATSRLVQLYFVESETTEGYFIATKDYIKSYGRPVAFYSDKHGIFRINMIEPQNGTGMSQFGRAMRDLGINIICANTPQAKGRVERVNGTLQDRLIKEMRLRKINNIEEANQFLPEFITDYNKRFSVSPASLIDAHRKSCPNQESLDLIFSWQCERILSKNLEFSYKNTIYQIRGEGKGYRMRKSKVKICDDRSGKITIIYQNRSLDYVTLSKQERILAPIISSKEIEKTVDEYKLDGRTSGHKPKENHPWKRYDLVAARKKRTNMASASASER